MAMDAKNIIQIQVGAEIMMMRTSSHLICAASVVVETLLEAMMAQMKEII